MESPNRMVRFDTNVCMHISWIRQNFMSLELMTHEFQAVFYIRLQSSFKVDPKVLQSKLIWNILYRGDGYIWCEDSSESDRSHHWYNRQTYPERTTRQVPSWQKRRDVSRAGRQVLNGHVLPELNRETSGVRHIHGPNRRLYGVEYMRLVCSMQ